MRAVWAFYVCFFSPIFCRFIFGKLARFLEARIFKAKQKIVVRQRGNKKPLPKNQFEKRAGKWTIKKGLIFISP